MKQISVVIPTQFKHDPTGGFYLKTALQSLFDQVGDIKFQVILGIDEGDDVPDFVRSANIEIAEASSKGLCPALNAALSKVTGDYVAILEDDDWWIEDFVTSSLSALAHFDFCSSTSLEMNADDLVVRINDFALPSSWFMRRSTLEAVGLFNEALSVHQDNFWLGKLNQLGLKRAHLIEATAPINPEYANVCRPWLANMAQFTHLGRHSSPWPLVVRALHDDSWMGAIAAGDPNRTAESQRCYDIIEKEFGHVPW